MLEITDEMLMAFADGQLGTADQRRVEEFIATRPDARARVDMFIRSRAELATIFNQALTESIPASLLAAINGTPSDSLSDVFAVSTVKRDAMQKNSVWSFILASVEPLRSLWQSLWQFPVASAAIAAALSLGIGIGSYFSSHGSLPLQTSIRWQDMVALNEGRILARGEFYRGLEKAPVGAKVVLNANSAQIALTPVMTFERSIGGYCRQYRLDNQSGAAVIGVACRNSAGDWAVEAQAEGAGNHHDPRNVRVAGAPPPQGVELSGSTIVDRAVDKLIKGDAFSPETEAALLASNWQPRSSQ